MEISKFRPTPNIETVSNCQHILTAPNESEFSHRVWISFFLFYSLVLSLKKFMGLYCLVLMHVFIILRNTKSRSSRKREAWMISQWFWCKHFAHIFILAQKNTGYTAAYYINFLLRNHQKVPETLIKYSNPPVLETINYNIYIWELNFIAMPIWLSMQSKRHVMRISDQRVHIEMWWEDTT